MIKKRTKFNLAFLNKTRNIYMFNLHKILKYTFTILKDSTGKFVHWNKESANK